MIFVGGIMELLGQILRTQITSGQHWWLLAQFTPDTLMWVFWYFSCVLHQWTWGNSSFGGSWFASSLLFRGWHSKRAKLTSCHSFNFSKDDWFCIATALQRMTLEEDETHISSLFEFLWRHRICIAAALQNWTDKGLMHRLLQKLSAVRIRN